LAVGELARLPEPVDARHLLGRQYREDLRSPRLDDRGECLHLPRIACHSGERRLDSKRYQARFSAPSIQDSSRLAVATSPPSSHTTCAARMREASCELSSRSSASMSGGVT